MEVEERAGGENGEPKVRVLRQHLKLHDAQSALKIMMEYHGLLSDILEVRRLPRDPAELCQFIKDWLPLSFSENKPTTVH